MVGVLVALPPECKARRTRIPPGRESVKPPMEAHKPRIAVELHGGLGNQLFQAAAALAVGWRLKAPVQFDLSRFRPGTKRRYELGRFPHGADEQSAPGWLRRGQKLLKTVGLARNRAPLGFNLPLVQEAHFHFDPAMEAISGSAYLRGLFQSPRYFAGFEPELRRIFSLEPHVSAQARAFAETLSPRTLAIHIRAGDYQDPKFADVHHVLTPDYYLRAIERVSAEASFDQVIVMSDSHEAIPSRLPAGLPYRIVSLESALDDLFLMSRASHNIIANSTFSWWGAWLGNPEGRVVVAPAQWFAPPYQAKVSTKDLFPAQWRVV